MKKILCIIGFFFLALPLSARSVTITVFDIDLEIPLEGARIRSWDGSEHICNQYGQAVIYVPQGRQVVIQAAYPGYETARLVIPASGEAFSIGLQLLGMMEGRELVIEAARPGISETRTGRSVAISGRDIAQTAEIGIIEDVMSSIKLLPGVGFAGSFNAQPSIRGGDPGDLIATLDGFYITNPYHWGGGFSIFDPRMVQSAQLSHGVFSARHGHTISGLLEITSKNPSPTDVQLQLGLNTSAANFNLSIPFNGRGGILLMGRVTYYDPVIWAAQRLSNTFEALDVVNHIRTAPYIRSTTITGNYRFSHSLELTATGFFGMDGVGVTFLDETRSPELNSDSYMKFDWVNYIGFLTAGLNWNPRGDMLVRFSAGAGFENSHVEGAFTTTILERSFSQSIRNQPFFPALYASPLASDPYTFYTGMFFDSSRGAFNAQARIDFDWQIRDGLLFAAGVQEKFTRFTAGGFEQAQTETWLGNLTPAEQLQLFELMNINDEAVRNLLRQNLLVSYPIRYDPNAQNMLFTTSGYALLEHAAANNRLRTELGLRVDHFYLLGRGFSLQSMPALNPRLNLDFNVLSDRGILQSFDLAAGTGLFSSVNDFVARAEKEFNLTEIRPNRSWTSVIGTRLEFPEGISLNLEVYYKRIFDRTYIPLDPGLGQLNINPMFDGEGRAWGVDLMLRRMQSRFWDGWISYSFNWTRLRDPGGSTMGIMGGNRGAEWYFPAHHRFHNLNIVFNYRPTPRFNIYTRLGLASGVQLSRRIGDSPQSFPVLIFDRQNPGSSQIIERFLWPSEIDENNRTTPSIPLDFKFSFFGRNQRGRARWEVYVAVENALALLYTAQGNTTFNQWTGEVHHGSATATYAIPIPIPSFGLRISF